MGNDKNTGHVSEIYLTYRFRFGFLIANDLKIEIKINRIRAVY